MKISKKICILGDFGVGKTSLVRRYVLNEFSPNYQATLGVNIYRYTGEATAIADEPPVTVNQVLWDIEGGNIGTSSRLNTYIHGAAGALIVGNSMDAATIEAMHLHAQNFQSVQVGRPVVFALNKSDLVKDRKMQKRHRSELESAFDTVAYATSAATGALVHDLFKALAERILQIGA